MDEPGIAATKQEDSLINAPGAKVAALVPGRPQIPAQSCPTCGSAPAQAHILPASLPPALTSSFVTPSARSICGSLVLRWRKSSPKLQDEPKLPG